MWNDIRGDPEIDMFDEPVAFPSHLNKKRITYLILTKFTILFLNFVYFLFQFNFILVTVCIYKNLWMK